MKRALLVSATIAAMSLAANCLAAGHARQNCQNCQHCQNCEPQGCQNCQPGLFQRCTSWMHAKHCAKCGKQCGPFHKCGGLLHHGRRNEMIDYGGPPAAQVTYPYYTNRGPRDFLDPNPRGIGP